MVQSDLVNWFIIQFTKKNRFKRMIHSRTGHHSGLFVSGSGNNIVIMFSFLHTPIISPHKTSQYWLFILSNLHMIFFLDLQVLVDADLHYMNHQRQQYQPKIFLTILLKKKSVTLILNDIICFWVNYPFKGRQT